MKDSRKILNEFFLLLDGFQAVTKRLEACLSSFKLDSLAERKAWVCHRLQQGVPVYLNLRSHNIRWQKPAAFDATDADLLVSVKEFQQLVVDVIDEEADHIYLRSMEPHLVRYLTNQIRLSALPDAQLLFHLSDLPLWRSRVS